MLANDTDVDIGVNISAVTELAGVTNDTSDVTGMYGTLNCDSDGTFTYTLDNANVAVC